MRDLRNPRSAGRRFLLAALVMLLALTAAPVDAVELDCRVLELPAVIDLPGEYCLDRDWVEPWGNVTPIEVRSDHVVIDFRGHLLINLSGLEGAVLSGYPIGVQAQERSHVVVRNGSIAGFAEGVSLSRPFEGGRSQNHLVEGMRVYDCRRIGIGVFGNDSVVRNNIVYDIRSHEATDPTGIWIAGYRNRVVGNTVSRITGGGKAADRWGIRFLEGGNHVILGNHLAGTWQGIHIEDTVSVYRDNLVLELPSGNPAFQGGIDGGGNVP